MTRSEQLFERAVKRIPGGVNSPVRSYGAIGEAPRFIEKADKCYIYDVDGNRYVDYIDSWGPMILGQFICRCGILRFSDCRGAESGNGRGVKRMRPGIPGKIYRSNGQDHRIRPDLSGKNL